VVGAAETEFISDPDALADALLELREPIAVDTEFHAEYRYRPKLMLIQLRDAAGRELVIDATTIRDLRPLGAALSGRRLLLHAAIADIPLLVYRAGMTPPAPGTVTDTQVLAGFAGLGYPRNLGLLLEAALGVSSSTSYGLSNWEHRPLSPQQLNYALEDVRHLHALAEALTERAGASAQLAREAVDELLARELADVNPDSLWREIPAAEVLDARGREILRRLAGWRERQARSGDRPPYQLCSNAVLLDVSRRQPKSKDELLMNRKAPRGVAKRHGEFLVSVVRDVWKLPVDALPASVARSPDERAAELLLEAWAAAVELQESVASRLLLPRWLKRRILDARRRGEPVSLVGWRHQWSDDLRALLEGRLALRVGAAGPGIEKVD